MADMKSLQEKLAIILCERKKQQYTRESPRAELYWQERIRGMSYKAIAENHGVTYDAVRKGCMRCGKKQEQES